MMPPKVILDYVKAEPFRPFRIHMASGQTFDIRHPEMIRLLRSSVIVFSFRGENRDIAEAFHSVSLMLAESISHIETAVA
jgi:hypothetical protein